MSMQFSTEALRRTVATITTANAERGQARHPRTNQADRDERELTSRG